MGEARSLEKQESCRMARQEGDSPCSGFFAGVAYQSALRTTLARPDRPGSAAT